MTTVESLTPRLFAIQACQQAATGIGGLASATGGFAARLFRLWQDRSILREMAALSDRALQDIGLTRADLTIMRARPFGQDATLELAKIAGHRWQSVARR